MGGEATGTIEDSIRELVAPGIKGVELACEVAVRHRCASDRLLRVLEGMVAAGEIVEVEYVTPENRDGVDARVKAFYLPAGTEVRVRDPRRAAA